MDAISSQWLMENWYIGLVALLAVIVILWLLLRKKPHDIDTGEAPPTSPETPRAPLEPRRPDIEDARRMDFKDAARFEGVNETVSGPMRPDAAPVARAAAPEVSEGDDLTRIKGLGPKLRAALAEQGVTRFSDIAAWSAEDITRIDTALPAAFQGRIARDNWVEQAALLAAGDEAAFKARFGAV